MKTRYSTLVDLKKNKVQKSEHVVQKANADLNSAATALQLSYNSLNDIESPQSGFVSNYLASRTLLDVVRDSIKHNKEWVGFAKKQVELAKEQLKLDMIEHEKFKYLDLQEVNEMVKKIKQEELKELDEVALMAFIRK